MKKADVKIGDVYGAKVSGKVVPVRIDAESVHGGWTGTNQATGKQVRIKSAQRLRYAMAKKDGKWRRVAAGAGKDATRANVGRKGASRAKAKKAKKAKAPRERKPGCLDAAVRVLKEAGRPMRCQDIVNVALERGYWQTKGKTPAATLYSAILREVGKKGEDARFRRADVKETTGGKTVRQRGYFQLTDAGKEE